MCHWSVVVPWKILVTANVVVGSPWVSQVPGMLHLARALPSQCSSPTWHAAFVFSESKILFTLSVQLLILNRAAIIKCAARNVGLEGAYWTIKKNKMKLLSLKLLKKDLVPSTGNLSILYVGTVTLLKRMAALTSQNYQISLCIVGKPFIFINFCCFVQCLLYVLLFS